MNRAISIARVVMLATIGVLPLSAVELFESDEMRSVSVQEGPLLFEMLIQPFVWDDFPDQHELRVSVAESPDHGTEIEYGQAVNDIPYFANGRTVIMENPATLFVARLAHIAIRYDLESRSVFRRSSELLEQTDAGLRIRWNPTSVTVARDEFTFADAPFETLTVVFFYDRNLDDVVDPGEIDRVRVEF